MTLSAAPPHPVSPWLRAALLAIAALLVILLIFSPRYIVWRGMGSELEIGLQADTYRAVSSLKMLKSPWVVDLPRSDLILRYRLLFPVLGHYTGMSPRLYLALPWVGVVASLLYVCRCLLRRGFTSWETFAAALVFGATSWLFTSSGWLSYPDAWLIFASLILAFSPSRSAQLAALLLTPWIDERFVFAAAIALAVRWGLSRFDGTLRLPERQWVISLGLLAAYLAVRFTLGIAFSSTTARYIANETSRPHVPLLLYLRGLWAGARLGWLFIAAFAILFLRRTQGLPRWGVVAAIFVPLVVLLPLAGDLGRSAAVIAPVVPAGMWLLREQSARAFRSLLCVSAVLSLAIPAEHVVETFQQPIRTAYTEVGMLRLPPAEFMPDLYVNAGIAAMTRKDPDAARANFNTAVLLDPKSARARLSRASWSLSTGDPDAALADAEVALSEKGDSPDAWLICGTAQQRLGHPEAALHAIQKAIGLASPAWPALPAAHRRLDQIRKSTIPASQPSSQPATQSSTGP